jgi:hypothetical protein
VHSSAGAQAGPLACLKVSGAGPDRARGRQPPGVQNVTGVAMLRARPGDLTLRLATDESRNMERCYGPVERRRRLFGHDEGHVEQAFVGAIG